ncbi:transglutaminase TgpA family protein [Luteipulveratus mongoliensis]|uniref:transglutaminase TgpA family protein n=1 Tax=Luteipulveratus mongoliensis TaxID=571913 RepID=UPI000697EA1A|nr:DUF3488 and transglutaminase-like domain-containing protein [Luteipulveratus mongoliensis]
MSRARFSEGSLAALAVIVATWPITTLLMGQLWFRPVLVLVMVEAAVGMLCRALGAARAIIVGAQVLAVLIGVLLIHLNDHLGPSQWADLPGAIGDLFTDASDTLSRYAAPAPSTPGIVFALSLIVPLVAIVVDLLSATMRMPALAGLPLLALFLLSTSNTGSALNPVYFVALAVVWLLMLARGGLQLLRRWSSTEAYSRTPERLEDRFGLAGYSSVARWIGVATVLTALVLPALIPHLPPRYISDGLARSTSGGRGGVGTVGFSDSLNLDQSLQDRSQTPILRYTTNDPTPPPLRALTMSSYSGGNWVKDDPRQSRPGDNNDRLPVPEGLSAQQPRTFYRTSISANGVGSPYVAVPWPVSSADFGDTNWTYDPSSATPRVRERAGSYEVTYSRLRANARPSSSHAADPPVPSTMLQLDPRSRALVQRTADGIVSSDDTDFAKAIKIQDWLRDTQRFTYSLTLKPAVVRNGRSLDPISNFLETKQGYCTQFATSMVMMARSQGIPARIAVGFLPGTKDTGTSYQVRASDAHAWPELYFPGMGWTRFEPTPGQRSGNVPEYASGADTSNGTAPGREASESSEPALPSGGREQDAATPTGQANAAVHPPQQGWLGSTGSWWTLLVLAIGSAGAVALPLAARWRREQPLRRATDSREQVEGQWHVLQSRLDDLGVDPPRGRTPRQLEQHYRQHATLGGDGRAALHRAVQTLEAVRYAPPSQDARSLDQDAERILRDIRSTASWQLRATALFIPRTGRRAVQQWLRDAVGAPGRWISRQLQRVGRG